MAWQQCPSCIRNCLSDTATSSGPLGPSILDRSRGSGAPHPRQAALRGFSRCSSGPTHLIYSDHVTPFPSQLLPLDVQLMILIMNSLMIFPHPNFTGPQRGDSPKIRVRASARGALRLYSFRTPLLRTLAVPMPRLFPSPSYYAACPFFPLLLRMHGSSLTPIARCLR